MNELLDEDIKLDKIITVIHGKLAPPGVVYGAYVIMLGGASLLTTLDVVLMIIGLGIIYIGAFAAFSKYGVLLDIENKKCKQFKGLLGFNPGKWISFNGYPDLSVLRVNMKSSISTRYGETSISSESYYYDICLLNKSHRSKILLERTKDQDLAYENAKKFAKLLRVNVTKFNPVISEKTKLRKAARNKIRR